jgi:hypothetical protein
MVLCLRCVVLSVRKDHNAFIFKGQIAHCSGLLDPLNMKTILLFLVNDQRDAQTPFCVFIFIFNSLHVSSTSCSSSGETNCVNTTSGNCHSVSVAVSCALAHDMATNSDSSSSSSIGPGG